jgi:hypothetical protein
MTNGLYPTIGPMGHHRGKTMAYVTASSSSYQEKACMDTLVQTPTLAPLSAIDSAISEAQIELDSLESRLGICLRQGSAGNAAATTRPTAVPESELVGRLFSISERLQFLNERIRELSGRVTL